MKELIYSVSTRDGKEPWIEVRQGLLVILREQGNISKLIMCLLEMGRNTNAFKKNAEKYPELVEEAMKKYEVFKHELCR